MKAVIVFREGHSGHFLKSVILDHPATVADFRINDCLRSQQNGINVVLTHDPSHAQDSDLVFRILPTRKIYNAIYNIFMKKVLLEEFPSFDLADWINDPIFWYDKCYYLIQEYYHQIHKDISTNTIQNVIDFDYLTNLDYLADLLQQHFHLPLNNNQRLLVNLYTKLQLQIDLVDDATQSMQEILTPIADNMLIQNPWFWAYAVFKFEHNNNLTEQHRLWSVNDFETPQTRSDLLQYQYQID
jgi:hypothetical protein